MRLARSANAGFRGGCRKYKVLNIKISRIHSCEGAIRPWVLEVAVACCDVEKSGT